MHLGSKQVPQNANVLHQVVRPAWLRRRLMHVHIMKLHHANGSWQIAQHLGTCFLGHVPHPHTAFSLNLMPLPKITAKTKQSSKIGSHNIVPCNRNYVQILRQK